MRRGVEEGEVEEGEVEEGEVEERRGRTGEVDARGKERGLKREWLRLDMK